MAEHNDELRPKGTVVLIYIFLACFVIFTYLNWKQLSDVWMVGG